VVRRHLGWLAPRLHSLSSRKPCRGFRDSCGLDRACPCGLSQSEAPWRASRSNVASDRLLHFETVLLEHPCSVVFPAQRRLARPSRDARSHRHSRPGGLAAPCSFTRTSPAFAASRPSWPVRKRATRGAGRLGARRCKRDWGEPRFTARFPLRRSGDSEARAFSSHAHESIPFASGTPVASFALDCVAMPHPWLEGRRDRFRGDLVKGVRFPDPEYLPPSVATRIPLGPKLEPNHEAFTFARRSRDEDRRARVNRPPFTCGAAPLRFARWRPPLARLPFTRNQQS